MRLFSMWLVVCSAVFYSGCSMCAPGYLDDYATVGGKWQRSDPINGRVGSIFSGADATISAGGIGGRGVDAHPQGIEGEVFGEAYTDEYPAPAEEFHELGEVPDALNEFDMLNSDGELMLGDEQ